MAEQDSGQERTEAPSGKRLQDAREKGQVPRSQELSTVVVLVASSVAMLFVGGSLINGLADVMTQSFSLNRKLIMDPHMMAQQLILALKIMAVDVGMFLGITLLAALSAPALIGGWNFSTQAIGVKLEKMSPLQGMKRMFGPQGLVELGKALGKFLLVGSIGTVILWNLRDQLLTLGRQEVQVAMTELGYIVLWGF